MRIQHRILTACANKSLLVLIQVTCNCTYSVTRAQWSINHIDLNPCQGHSKDMFYDVLGTTPCTTLGTLNLFFSTSCQVVITPVFLYSHRVFPCATCDPPQHFRLFCLDSFFVKYTCNNNTDRQENSY